MRVAILTLVVWALTPCPGIAQDGVALWTASAGDLSDLALDVAREARRALGRSLVAPAEASCDPSDEGCVAHLLAGTGARRLVVVRTVWARGPCVPIVRDGVREGSRMLRTPVVELTLYGADGTTLGTSTVRRADPGAIAPDVGEALERLLAP